MRIKATRASYGDFGHVARNRILDDVPTGKARELIERGLYTEVKGDAGGTPESGKAGRGRQQKPAE